MKTQNCSRNWSRKVESAGLNTCWTIESKWILIPISTPLDLLSFEKQNRKFCIRLMMTWSSRNLCLEYIKYILYSHHHTHKKACIIGSCYDICAPRVLYQVTINSFKRELKNSVKLQQSKGLLWSYSQIGDSAKGEVFYKF